MEQLRQLRRTLLISVPVLVIVALGGVVALRNARVDTVEFELVKTLLQVGLVGVVGWVLSSVSTQYQSLQADVELSRERRRKADEYQREVLSSVLERTTTAYNGVKQARRLMRAKAWSCTRTRTVLVVAVYDEYMTRLNDLQLEFETLRDEVDTPQQSEVFSRLDELSRLFSDLEMYLGKLVSEYEGERPGMAKDKVSNLEGLSLLLKFLGRGGFGEFSKPYHDVRTRLRQDLANNRTGTDASARSPAN